MKMKIKKRTNLMTAAAMWRRRLTSILLRTRLPMQLYRHQMRPNQVRRSRLKDATPLGGSLPSARVPRQVRLMLEPFHRMPLHPKLMLLVRRGVLTRPARLMRLHP